MTPCTAGNLTFVIDEDQALNVNQTAIFSVSLPGPANESDQTLTIVAVDAVSAQSGSIRFSNGVITYTPRQDFAGTDTFKFTISDNGMTGVLLDPLTAVGTISITIRDKNDPPTTTPKNLTTDEDVQSQISITDIIAGDTPGPANESTQTVTFSGIVPLSTNGGRVERVGNNIVYTPPQDFNGVDTFFYTVVDNGTSQGVADPQTATGTVTVAVRPINDAPKVIKSLGSVTMIEDDPEKAIVLAQYFVDPDVIPNGDVVTFSIESNSNTTLVDPTFGSGNLFLHPKADQNGKAIIVVKATDTQGASSLNTLTLTVTPVDDAPRLVTPLPDVTVDEDSSPADLVLSPTFFFDPDVINGDTLTFEATSSNLDVASVAIVGNKLKLTLVPDASGQTTIFVSAHDVSGTTITDSYVVTINPVNDPPRTVADSYVTPQGVPLTTTDARGTLTTTQLDDGVLANDRDPEGDTFTAAVTTQPTLGTVQMNSDGTFTYTPGPSALFGATDTFKYKATDSVGAASTETTVTITIGRAPRAKYQNPTQPKDVNADGFVSPIDVLVVINLLNAVGASIPVAGLPGPPDYVDVNGNNTVEPLDALLIIDYINSRSGFGGEGESSTMVVMPSAAPSLSWYANIGRESINGSYAVAETVQPTIERRVANAAQPQSSLNSVAVQPSLAEYLARLTGENDPVDVLARSMVAKPSKNKSASVDSALLELFGN